MAAAINGGNERNLDPGFAKLKALRPSFVSFYTSNVQSIRMLETGEVAVIAWGVLPNVIQHLGPDSKYGFAVPKPIFVAETPITIVANTPNAGASAQFVNYVLSPEVQEILAAALGSMPANPKAKPPAILQQLLPSLEGIYKVDYDLLAKEMNAIIDRYNREIMN
jgi:putative spermidine/putrescine transport system substrate-binding protein